MHFTAPSRQTPLPQPQHQPRKLRHDPAIQVRPWVDPTIDPQGVDARSVYFERFWLPILGPSATLLVRRLVSELEASPEGFTLTPIEWAQSLGLGGLKGGAHGPFGRALGRTGRFAMTHQCNGALLVRRRFPPLSDGQLGRLAAHIRRDHDRWIARQQRKT